MTECEIEVKHIYSLIQNKGLIKPTTDSAKTFMANIDEIV